MTIVAAFIVFVLSTWVLMALLCRAVKDGQDPLVYAEKREVRG